MVTICPPHQCEDEREMLSHDFSLPVRKVQVDFLFHGARSDCFCVLFAADGFCGEMKWIGR